MNSKKFILHFIKIFILGEIALFSLFALLYIYDPLQFFHKPWFRETTFSNDMRIQNLGIIRHYDFDSVILGTSMLENTSAKEASQKLNSDFVNLSMAGARFNVRALILNYLLKKKEIKNIIYSVELTTIYNYKDEQKVRPLYDNYFKSFSFYLNKKYLKCAFELSLSKNCIGGGGVRRLNFLEKYRPRQTLWRFSKLD